MTEASVTAVIVALIAGPLMWWLNRRDVRKAIGDFDDRNTEQHGQSMAVLSRIDAKMDRMDGKVDRLDEKVDRLDERVTNVEAKGGRRRSVSS